MGGESQASDEGIRPLGQGTFDQADRITSGFDPAKHPEGENPELRQDIRRGREQAGP